MELWRSWRPLHAGYRSARASALRLARPCRFIVAGRQIAETYGIAEARHERTKGAVRASKLGARFAAEAPPFPTAARRSSKDPFREHVRHWTWSVSLELASGATAQTTRARFRTGHRTRQRTRVAITPRIS